MRETQAIAGARAASWRTRSGFTIRPVALLPQWAAVREAAHARGIRIMGDVPIYVAGDSADVWANRELFQLDEDGEPTRRRRRAARLLQRHRPALGQSALSLGRDARAALSLVGGARPRRPALRRRRARSITSAASRRTGRFPAAEQTAMHGRWVPGPAARSSTRIRDALGDVPLVAEDLGFITPEVHELRARSGIPGMKILQFAFGARRQPASAASLRAEHGRLHRHARQRHRARLVRDAPPRRSAPSRSHTSAATTRRRRLGADPRRLHVASPRPRSSPCRTSSTSAAKPA